MKALSMKQPWAWLVCAGHKDIENRTWHIHMPPLLNYPADPRRIYVHAGKKVDDSAWNFFHHLVDASVWRLVASQEFYQSLARGAIIGEVDIVGCTGTMKTSPWHQQGMYGLLLANPVLYDQPIPCKGKLGFFEPDIPEKVRGSKADIPSGMGELNERKVMEISSKTNPTKN